MSTAALFLREAYQRQIKTKYFVPRFVEQKLSELLSAAIVIIHARYILPHYNTCQYTMAAFFSQF